MKEYIAVERQTDNGGYIEIVSELIRCKDCIFKEDYRGWNKWCIKNSFNITDDDYCSWAERKEE